MDMDRLLMLGLGLIGLSLPAILSAWSESRAPRVGAVTLVAGAAVSLHAMTHKPGGYRLADLPDVFYSVIGGLLH